MADSKISALPSASTPLVGTEVLPIVQSGVTVKTPVSSFYNYQGFKFPYTIVGTSIPMTVVSSGTMGNNGALSGIGAVATIYPNAYVYLPANAIFTGSALGWYYAVFSSTTAATVYNNTYTTGTPTIPASPTAFVTTGPGSYTQASIPSVVLNYTLPASTLSITGKVEVDVYSTQTTNSSLILTGVGTNNLQSNASTTFQSLRVVASARNAPSGLFLALAFTSSSYNGTNNVSTDSLSSPIAIQITPRSLTVATTSVTLETVMYKIYP